LDEMSDQFGINWRDHFIFSGKTNALRPGPGEPGAVVRFPFGRHPEAELSRSEHEG
jgi:hypothetical protein